MFHVFSQDRIPRELEREGVEREIHENHIPKLQRDNFPEVAI
jgi:hypothetical protein